MEPLAAVAAVGAICSAAGAAGALLARSTRMAVLGLGAALAFAPLTMSPLPPALPAAFWLVAALLVTYVLLIAVRERAPTVPAMPLGGGVEAAFVGMGLALGWAVSAVTGPDRGASSALAAGIALAFAAAPLAMFGRDALRAGMSGIFALGAGALLVAGLAGTPGTAAITAFAVALLAAAAGAWGVMRLEVRALPVGPGAVSRGASHLAGAGPHADGHAAGGHVAGARPAREAPEGRAPQRGTPEGRTPEGRTPEGEASESGTPKDRGAPRARRRATLTPGQSQAPRAEEPGR